MRYNYFYAISILLIVALMNSSCSKKDVEPRLIIHVQEKSGAPAEGAIVHVWPGSNPNTQTGSGNGSGIIDEEGFDQTATTDAAGDVTFDFEFSAVLDVDVIYLKNGVDSFSNPIVDTLLGHKVVKIERVRQSSDENNYNETVEVK